MTPIQHPVARLCHASPEIRGWKTLKIELADAGESREGFNITELENQQNAATGDEDQKPGTLSIVEAEIYETASENGS